MSCYKVLNTSYTSSKWILWNYTARVGLLNGSCKKERVEIMQLCNATTWQKKHFICDVI